MKITVIACILLGLATLLPGQNTADKSPMLASVHGRALYSPFKPGSAEALDAVAVAFVEYYIAAGKVKNEDNPTAAGKESPFHVRVADENLQRTQYLAIFRRERYHEYGGKVIPYRGQKLPLEAYLKFFKKQLDEGNLKFPNDTARDTFMKYLNDIATGKIKG